MSETPEKEGLPAKRVHPAAAKFNLELPIVEGAGAGAKKATPESSPRPSPRQPEQAKQDDPAKPESPKDLPPKRAKTSLSVRLQHGADTKNKTHRRYGGMGSSTQ